MATILRWLDGDSPESSLRNDSQVMSSNTTLDSSTEPQQTPEDLPNEETSDSSTVDHSSVTAIEADLMEVSTKAVHAVKDWGNYLFNLGKSTGAHVGKTAMQLKSALEDQMLAADAMEEDGVAVNGAETRKALETVIAPWVGYNEEETMKAQILALSKDKRNFIRPPPASCQFFFDYEVSYPVALVMLSEDANLKTMRFELVPKHLREETFWRNYFYRVSLVKQSVQLTSLATCSVASKTASETASIAENDISGPPDIDLTLSACELPADDIELGGPDGTEAELDDREAELEGYEFVSVADVNDPGNG